MNRLLPTLVEIAKKDSSGLVRLTLASTLQRLPVALRLDLAIAIASQVEFANDHNLPLLVWYGLIPTGEKHSDALAVAACQFKWAKLTSLATRRIAENLNTSPQSVDMLLQESLKQDYSVQQSVLIGLQAGLRGWVNAKEPSNWKSFSEKFKDTQDALALEAIKDLSLIFGDGMSNEEAKRIVLDNNAEIGLRRSALQALVHNKPDVMREVCEAVLGDARLNLVAVEGLASVDDPAVAELIVKRYRSFRAPVRSQVISILCSRKSFAKVLLQSVAAGKIAAGDITAFDARQLMSLEDEEVNRLLAEHWGQLNDSSEAKLAAIAKLKSRLITQDIQLRDKGHGRALFTKHCAKCHRMYGEGEIVGPDLTGANRSDLDYLLNNIVDPSAVVSKDFRMSIIATTDDRVMNGLIVAKNENTLTLQTQNERVTLPMAEIAEIKQTSKSPMPDGLLDQLNEDEVDDLIAYLRYPVQVTLPSDSK